ncbi:MAG: D-Ala-D-Ala carboxypeptidase family metallohydrolase [Candidatus Krumholzibacteria bacterium]|nr:D-Ala-D-Ala carboxypeptidase family metallohydrolase [Candidatus Krumholzibacteria bacterium]
MAIRKAAYFIVTALAALIAVFPTTIRGLTNQNTPPFDTGRVAYTVKFRGLDIPYRVMAVFAMPEEILEFAIGKASPGLTFVAKTHDDKILEGTGPKWSWRAPATPGLFPLTISETSTEESVTLNVFVLVPASSVKNGLLNGYRIDDYPRTPYKGLEIYRAPAGFVEVTRDNVDTSIAPHFTLRQFLCKQESGYPKYLVLRTRLLLKLELLLQRVNEKNYRYDTFAVMSGYRTPYYNKAIGNVKYSRHVWGGAADIYLDNNPKDGNMDDLNGDGRIDVGDAAVLYKIFDDLYGKPFYAPSIGGLGQYRKTNAHGPFVHVDVRGFRARWGD